MWMWNIWKPSSRVLPEVRELWISNARNGSLERIWQTDAIHANWSLGAAESPPDRQATRSQRHGKRWKERQRSQLGARRSSPETYLGQHVSRELDGVEYPCNDAKQDASAHTDASLDKLNLLARTRIAVVAVKAAHTSQGK
jgi:hypothetical protein